MVLIILKALNPPEHLKDWADLTFQILKYCQTTSSIENDYVNSLECFRDLSENS